MFWFVSSDYCDKKMPFQTSPILEPILEKKAMPCVLILFSYTRNKPKNSSTTYIRLTRVTNGRVIKAGCQMLSSLSGILNKIYFVACFWTRYHPPCNAAHKSKHLLILVFFSSFLSNTRYFSIIWIISFFQVTSAFRVCWKYSLPMTLWIILLDIALNKTGFEFK